MNDLDKRQERLLNIQNIGSVVYIVSLILSIYLTYDEQTKLHNERLLDDRTAIGLSTFNRTLVLILTFVFLFTSYENTSIAKAKGKDLSSYELQNRASELSVLSAVIVLYVILKNADTENFNVSKIENPAL